jgi:hypothetical protein
VTYGCSFDPWPQDCRWDRHHTTVSSGPDAKHDRPVSGADPRGGDRAVPNRCGMIRADTFREDA